MPALRSPLIHPFSNFDVPHLLRVHVEARPDHPFLIWEPFEGEARVWSYARFEHEVRQVAAGLKKRGVKQGERVLIHLDNCPESLIAWYACAHLGAVAVTTNARSVADDLIYFSGHAEVVGAITQPAFASLVASSCARIKWLAVTETDNGAAPQDNARPPKSESFAALYGDPADVPMRAPEPMLPVGIQYTSGTTSRPKGVVWTHANALWGAKLCAMHEDLRQSDVHLTYLPLFHTNAQSYSVLAALWVGATVVLQRKHFALAGSMLAVVAVGVGVLAFVALRRPASAPAAVATAPAQATAASSGAAAGAPATPPAPVPSQTPAATAGAATPRPPVATPAGGASAPEAAGARTKTAAAAKAPAKDMLPIAFDAKALVGTGERSRERDAQVLLADGKVTVTADNKDVLHSVPYAGVISVSYSRGRNPLWNSPKGPAPVARTGGGAFGFIRGERHWIALRTKDAFVVLRLQDEEVRRVLGALEERTGRTPERVVERKDAK